jgi:hypothetical protein
MTFRTHLVPFHSSYFLLIAYFMHACFKELNVSEKTMYRFHLLDIFMHIVYLYLILYFFPENWEVWQHALSGQLVQSWWAIQILGSKLTKKGSGQGKCDGAIRHESQVCLLREPRPLPADAEVRVERSGSSSSLLTQLSASWSVVGELEFIRRCLGKK